ncbi:MAG: diacylglycerol/lipid kinase family protein [Streptosporangiaceae bacterium]
MRALLIVNPHATSTTRQRRDVISRALASAVDLEVVETRYRGEATKLAATAAADKFGLVMTLGGDGTVNEAVNGILGSPDDAEARRDAADLPALAALPGGNANVFTRSLQLPSDAVDATGRLIEDLASGRERCIGLGTVNGRYFTFNAGLGLDAEVVRAVEGRRAHGQGLTPTLFFTTALRQYYRVTDRRHPAISVTEPAGLCPEAAYLCIVSNSAPWTYLGRRPVNPSPRASFDTGLDLMALRRLGTLSTARTLRQMLTERTEPPDGRAVAAGHDLDSIVLRADRPVAFQLDGEYMGEVEEARFRSVPRALRVIGLPEG